MNRRSSRTLLSLAILSALALPALAQTERRYDDRGRYIGRTETQGGTTHFYDDSGRYTGRSETQGGTTRLFSGRSQTTG
jgi:YD repeat-containing protein